MTSRGSGTAVVVKRGNQRETAARCTCPGKRVSPQENHSEAKRGRESFGPGLHKCWIVELHANTNPEHPRIHRHGCLLPDYDTHGWLRQLPVSPLHSPTAGDDYIDGESVLL